MQLGVICHIGESPVFIPFGPFAVYHICLVLFFPPQAESLVILQRILLWKAVTTNFESRVYEDTCWTFVDIVCMCSKPQWKAHQSVIVACCGLGFIRYSSGCVFIRSKQDKDTAEMQLAIVFFIDTPSSLVVHHNLEAQIFSYP